MRNPNRIYRLFLKLYPARFREEYTGPLERQFADDYRDAIASGATLPFWVRLIKDLLVSLAAEILRETAQDLCYALRVYRRRLLVTGLALTALTLGIGATTGVFSVLNAVLWRSLPFRDPDRLVELRGGVMRSRADYYQWQSTNTYLSDAATFSSGDMNLDLGGDSVRTKVAETSAGFFRTLGVEPVFGRSFASDEDLQGHDAVAVIGYGLWQQLFAGNTAVLGKEVILNGTSMTVIGVAPPSFDYPGRTTVWMPTAFDIEKVPKSGVVFWRTLGRLKSGLPLVRANSMYRAEMPQLNPPKSNRKPPADFSRSVPELVPLRDQLAGPVRQASLVLLGIVAFVLLIACANVAHLLLSRFAERRQELAVRAALGASRARLVQQLITESTLLTLSASAAGLAIARWAAKVAAMVQPAPLETQGYTVLDGRVLAFALAVAALTGILFGVLPAIVMGRTQPSADPLRSHGGAQGAGVNRVRFTLIAMQSALTLMLVAGSFLMGRAFLKLLNTDLGFHTDQVVTLNVSLSGTRYDANHTQAEYYRQALERLRAIPGVQSAAAAQFLPLVENSYMGQQFTLDSTHKVPVTLTLPVSAGYFQTMRTRILDGREFTVADRAGSDAVMIVNQAFARQLGMGERIVGRKISGWRGDKQYTIVGVVADERLSGPSWEPHQAAFFPIDQWTPGFVTFVARVRGRAESYLAACRDTLRQLDPHIPVYDLRTFDQRLSDNLKQPRFYTIAVLFFAGFALLLALIGIYGMAAYSVTRRRHEIGVRMAVGANFAQVRFMLLRETLLPLMVGIAAGVAAAIAVANSLKALIYRAPALDGATCGGAAFLLSLAAVVAVWSATRRILKLDPIRTLRVE
ncbi:MAG TPA: ABC transporter permease [Bryobacteraceae bacterium]|nr:ABC transporter permease [Bryobacteraceae bacterium]